MKLIARFFNLIVFPLTILSGAVLSLSGLVPLIHPNISTWLQLLGLAFPFLFILNVLWLVYWWIQRKFKMVVPLCFLIFNLFNASKYLQFTRDRKDSERTLHVATFNTMLFGATQKQWFFDTVIADIKSKNLDIVCLQEVYAKKDLDAEIRNLRKAGNFKMYSLYKLTPDRPYGMAILSKKRIIRSGRLDFPDNTGNMAMWADIEEGADTIRVYNVHLQSIRFKKSDYEVVNNATTGQGYHGSRTLLLRMREAYIKRAAQAEVLATHMKGCKLPMVVAGDFNDVPLSYAYRKVAKDLVDAFCEAGNGMERTYKGPFPSFRIDYILFSKNIGCTFYKSYDNVPGDHKMVTASLDLSKLVKVGLKR
jgi:endonuclease/exonuclease/phosphatase family metal-dependent hydrolase